MYLCFLLSRQGAGERVVGLNLVVMAQAITRESIELQEASRAEQRAPSKESSRESLLVIGVGKGWFALPAVSVVEVCDGCEPTPVPHAPLHVRGLMNFRGRAVPLVDLGCYLGMREASGMVSSRVAVVEGAGMRVGLLCDRVLGVLEVRGNEITSPELFQTGKERAFVRGQVTTRVGVTGVADVVQLLEATKVLE